MKSKTLIFATALLLACGGDDSTNTDGGKDASTGDSGGNTDGGGTDGGGTSKAYFGSVNFSESKTQSTTTYVASAGFYATPDGGTAAGGCTGTKSGSCCYTPATGASDAGTPPAPTPVSAGGITVKDGTSTIATMTPTGTTYTPITNQPTTTLTWVDGDSLDISAAGDTVHAFSGSVTAATLFAAVTPALSFTTPTNVPRASDFTVTWTAKTGSILLTMSALKVAVSDGTISCTASSDTGTITVPHDLMANFTAADTGVVTLSRTSSGAAAPDNAAITLNSSTSTGGTVLFQ